MKAWVAVAVTIVLAGCGGPTISEDEAADIAALSQDAGIHHRAFTEAILELSGNDKCSAEVMRSNGGFSKMSGKVGAYFIYCGTPMNASRRWYINPRTGELTRIKGEL